MLNGIPRFSSAQNAYFDLTAETELNDSIGHANDLLDVDASSSGCEGGRQQRSSSLAPGKSRRLLGGYKGNAITMLIAFIIFVCGLLIGNHFGRDRLLAAERKRAQSVAEASYTSKLSGTMQQQLMPQQLQLMANKLRGNNVTQRLLHEANSWGFDSVSDDKFSISVEDYAVGQLSQVAISNGSQLLVVAKATALVGNSAAGNISAEFAFANLGRQSDINELLRAASRPNCSGLVLLLRSASEEAIAVAAACGAAGLVLFTDSCSSAGDSLRWQAPSAAGDAKLIATMPAAAVSFADAMELLAQLANTTASPSSWPVAYAPFMGPSLHRRLILRTRSQRRRRTAVNIIATVAGQQQADSYVLIGARYNAACAAGGDRMSGPTVLAAIGRAIGSAVRSGWRPLRSLLLAFWDAEPLEAVGVQRFAASRRAELVHRAAAYLSLDCPVSAGAALRMRASPELSSVLHKAAAAGNVSVDWSGALPIARLGRKLAGMLGGGSDHAAFVFGLGIPSALIQFTAAADCEVAPTFTFAGSNTNSSSSSSKSNSSNSSNSSSSSSSSSFKKHSAAARVTLDAALRLAASQLLAYDSEALANIGIVCYNQLLPKLTAANATASAALRQLVEEFSKRLQRVAQVTAGATAPTISRQLALLPRCFVRAPQAGEMRNVLLGPGSEDPSRGTCFPFVQQQLSAGGQQLQREIDLISDAFREANRVLRLPDAKLMLTT